MTHHTFKLLIQMIIKFLLGFLIMGLILFGCAGTINYPNGWLFIVALAIPMIIFGFYLLFKSPKPLERRLKSKEADKKQVGYIATTGLAFIVSFLLAGFDYRFGWSNMPWVVSIIAVIIMLLGYGLFFKVIIQNAYASRVIEVSDKQTIITTGLYGIVRHPMYTATLLLFLAMPIVLGSYFAFVPMLIYPFIIVGRIKNEEVFLEKKFRRLHRL